MNTLIDVSKIFSFTVAFHMRLGGNTIEQRVGDHKLFDTQKTFVHRRHHTVTVEN